MFWIWIQLQPAAVYGELLHIHCRREGLKSCSEALLAPDIDKMSEIERTVYISNSPSFSPLPSPRPTLEPLSETSLVFVFTRPSPSRSPATAFLLKCIPDPIAFCHQAARLIQSRLSPGTTWRHQILELELSEEDGLAWTSGGHVRLSLRFVEHVAKEVEEGGRTMEAAIHEFKGISKARSDLHDTH